MKESLEVVRSKVEPDVLVAAIAAVLAATPGWRIDSQSKRFLALSDRFDSVSEQERAAFLVGGLASIASLVAVTGKGHSDARSWAARESAINASEPKGRKASVLTVTGREENGATLLELRWHGKPAEGLKKDLGRFLKETSEEKLGQLAQAGQRSPATG